MAKTAQGVPFTAIETASAHADIATLLDLNTKGAERWSALRALAMNGKEIDTVRKQQLATWYRDAWIERAVARKGVDLTTDEVIAAKNSANADFSRGMRDPSAKPKAKGAQTGKAATQSDAAATGKDTLAEQQQASATGDFARQQMAKDLQVRVASVQAELIQFQTNVRIPKQGQALIGDIAEQLNKLHEQAMALVASFA